MGKARVYATLSLFQEEICNNIYVSNSTGQIREIERYRLSSVLCDAMNGAETMQPHALLREWAGPLSDNTDR